MRNLMVVGFAILLVQFSKAQTDNLKWLDIELSNYEYPYEVSVLNLKAQGQDLQMSIWM